MNAIQIPSVFRSLSEANCIAPADILSTDDGFFLVNKSLSGILAEKEIGDFPDSSGQRLPCSAFFDDWFLYAVPDGSEYTYSLLKLREQEHDSEDGAPADGDVPGVTISFIAFHWEILLACLSAPTDENRAALNREINRVVAYRGQRHHNALKWYFIRPDAEAAYLVAELYTKYIAAFSQNGILDAPQQYKQLVQQHISYKSVAKFARLPQFIERINQHAGRVVCDHEKLYIQDPAQPDVYESVAILATHTGNTSVFSFAAEVQYHAKFLTALARIKIPFFGRSIYDSAIRADMTIGDTEFEGPAPFHRPNSPIVKRQFLNHRDRPMRFPNAPDLP